MSSNKAAVFILLGQSNAVGHGIPMLNEDMIKAPLKNIFGLNRNNNQAFDSRELAWSGYTSFGMNLGEEQDNTYSLANCLAQLWQSSIDSGNKDGLPDLYIIQIAVGAQGVTREYMWYPEKEKTLIPGKLGTVDISLFPFSCHIFKLLEDSFIKLGRNYEIIGLHWRGGENDVTESSAYLHKSLKDIYSRIFSEFNTILKNPPLILHEIHCPDRMNNTDPTGKQLINMHYINSVFKMLETDFENIETFDVRTAPFYSANGIFIDDAVHYTPQTNKWVAQKIIEAYISSHRI